MPLTLGHLHGESNLTQQTSPQYFITMDAFADGGTLHWTSLASAKSTLGVADSGWANLPLANCNAYDAGSTPRYRKCGNVVNLCGAAKPKANVAAGGSVQIGTMPAGYRPPVDINVLCQGSGNSVWLLTVQAGGQVGMSRYRNGASANAQCTTSNWLPFNVTYMCA